MAANVTGLHLFADDVGPIPLSLLDSNYSALNVALNTLNTFSNYLVDTGTVNNIVVSSASTQFASYADGLTLEVLVNNTTTGPVTCNLNNLGAIPVQLSAGGALPTGALWAKQVVTLVYVAYRNAFVVPYAGGGLWSAGGGGSGTQTAPFKVNDTTANTLLQVQSLTTSNPAGSATLQVSNFSGANNAPTGYIASFGYGTTAPAGNANGVWISAGTNVSDQAFSVGPAASGSNTGFLIIRGDGSGTLGPNKTNCLAWDVNGHFSTLGTATLPGGGTGGSSTLSGLADVSISGQSNGQVLTWNTASARWVNQSPTGGASLTAPVTIYMATPPAVTLTVEGSNNFPALFAGGSNVSGSSQGLQIIAGFNAADWLIKASNWAQSPAYYFQIWGDGHGFMGPNPTTAGMSWTSTGNFSFASTSGTSTVSISGVSPNTAALTVGTGGASSLVVKGDGSGYIGPNAANCLQWTTGGAFTLLGSATLPPPPALTTPLSLPAPPGNNATLIVYGAIYPQNSVIDVVPGAHNVANQWALQIGGNSGSAAGCSNGIFLAAGTNASDAALKILNDAMTATYMLVRGDGSGTLGQGMTWDASGNVTIITPPPTTSGQWYMQLGGGTPTTAGNSFGLQVLAGTNSSDAALSIKNDAGTAEMLHIAGDGSGWIGVNSTTSFSWTAAGAFNVNGGAISAANTPALTSTGPANSFAFVGTSATTTAARGVMSLGGMTSNASTVVLQVVGSDWANTFLKIYADGHGQIGPSTTNYLGWDTTGAFTVHGTASLPSGGGGSSTLAGLTDVSIASPLAGQVLTYNGSTSKWSNSGAVTLYAPSPAATTLLVEGSANNPTLMVSASNVSGQSLGLRILAGYTSADYCLAAFSLTGTQYMLIRGDGSGLIGPASSTTFAWNATGDFTINTDLNCTAGLYASQTSSSGTWWALKATNPTSAAGFNNGVNITAGRSSTDHALLVQDYSATNQFFSIAGNGTGTLGPNATNCLTWDTSGHFTLLGTATLPGGAPTPPVTLDMTGKATTGQALLCIAPNDATNATAGGWAGIMQAPASGNGRGAGLAVIAGPTGSYATDITFGIYKQGWAYLCHAFHNDGSGYIGGAYGAAGAFNWDTLNNFSVTGGTLTMGGAVNGYPLTVNRATANTASLNYLARFYDAKSAAGFNYGVYIQAGLNASDVTFTCQNSGGTTTFFAINGVGATSFPAIGTTASAANAFLDNTASNNFLRSTSARRYKKNVKSVSRNRAREIVQKLKAVTFNSLCAADDPKQKHYGLVAEDVAEVEPALVTFDEEGKPAGVQYERVLLLLLPLMQELLGEPS